MRYYIIILLTFLLTSCGVQWKYSSLNTTTHYDGIYGITDKGDTLQVDVIDSRFDLDRKFRFDNKFRWNYSMYAMNQDYIWHQDFFWRNRMFRNGYGFSSWDFYWNRHDFWWNWSAGYPYNYGWSHWNNWGWHRDPFYYRPGWNYGYGFNNWGWRNRMNDYAWEHRDRRNVVYVNGRRGSNNVVNSNSSRGRTNNIISNSNTRINRGRTNIPNDIVVEESPTLIDRFVRKIENAGVRIRTYQNETDVINNNNLRIRQNNNEVRVNPNNNRNYIRPQNNQNIPRNNYSGTRTNSSPRTTIRSNSGRSNNSTSVKSSTRRN